MNEPRLILIVDDDPHIREVVRFALQTAGFRTAEARDGKHALTVFDEMQPDLVVLDILMPGIDGTEVCRTIRAHSAVPIIFLSSLDEEVDRIVGLELGGDDYVTKPFSPRELVARVKAVMRRTSELSDHLNKAGTNAKPTNQIRHGRLSLDLDRFQAFWNHQEVVLTVTEFNLVRTLLGYPGKVFTRDELMQRSYSFDTVVTDRTIDSHIRRVRKKFADAEADPIETVYGVGYKLGPCR